MKRVGLFAVNGLGIRAPETDAPFDFFEVRSLVPEAKTEDETPSARGKQTNVETR